MILIALIGDYSDENDHIEEENLIQKTFLPSSTTWVIQTKNKKEH